jgi:hypothetical protein
MLMLVGGTTLAMGLAAGGCAGDGGQGGDSGVTDIASSDTGRDTTGTDPGPADANRVDSSPDIQPDSRADDLAEVDADATDASDATVEPPPFNPDAAALAFRLYYRERVERAVVSYNRFMLFGGATFGITIGKAGIARDGDTFEVVPGPNDNNHIGASVNATWAAYRIFRTRTLALSLIRMFDGLVFLERVSGHDGLTGRLAYPGWTMTVDGLEGTVTQVRAGESVEPPFDEDPDLVREIVAAFFDGVRVTYIEEPEHILLTYMPVRETGPYSATYGFSMLPSYLRVSDCCTSLMQVPEPHPWAGAFWSNHNSRDNFPDLGLGFVAAMEAKDDPEADPDLREAAKRAWEAGLRVGDRIQDSGGRIMTVDEHHDYETLTVSGAVRPDGETESEDLGSMADCQMAFLARALSAQGLGLPLPELPLPGSLEDLLGAFLTENEGCAEPGIDHTCTLLGEAICKRTWGNIGDLTMNGTPWLELIAALEEETPGTADLLLGGFQDDFHEISLAGLALVEYARTKGDRHLTTQTREALSGLTAMMRTFGELCYGKTDPGRLARRRYIAALTEGQAGLGPNRDDLADFLWAEQQMARIESMLSMADTVPAPLKTDEDILQEIASEVSRRSRTVKARYQESYGDSPPVRRTEDGYEARVFHEGEAGPWQLVPNTRHVVLGGIELLEALPICLAHPEILDCSWARLGCARPDLNKDGTVDQADGDIFQQARATHGDNACSGDNEWCGGADLDRSGVIDDLDAAFLEAAFGCHYRVQPG